MLPADVADAQQVEAAAQEVDKQFGPIDAWVNVAMTSVFSPTGSPAASYESVAQPNWITPSYVFSIPMRYACSRVAFPTQRTSRPVASGSSVPV